MDSSSGMVGRAMASMTTNARSRDFNGGVAMNGADGERTTHSTLGWGASSIWNNNSIGSGFGSAVRDSSRPRENSTYMATPSEPIEGKTGSGSLVASSESDGWHHGRSSWMIDGPAASMAHMRSGVSPARKRSIVQPEPSQQYTDNSAAFFPASRSVAVGQAPVSKPNKPLLDPTSMNFTSARRADPLSTNGFSSFVFNQPDVAQHSEASVGSWPDAASVHSPTDDRRSVANSEYFGPSSAAPSRSGSLPPSRHGNEPHQFGQTIDTLGRYAQPGQRQHSSFSLANGRAFQQERSGSIQSEALHMLGKLSFEHEADLNMMSHRPSMSINGLPPTFSPALNEASLARNNYADSQALGRSHDAVHGHAGTDNFANGLMGDPTFQFRPVAFDSRSAPNGTGVRQSPFQTHSHTPPTFDHLYPSRSDQTLTSHSNNTNLLRGKLQGYQISQEPRGNFIHPNQLHPQQIQQLLMANQLRNAYPYQHFAMPNVVSLNNLAPNLPMAPLQAVIPIEAPKAPRDHSNPTELQAMSNTLYNFRNASKMQRRFELREIYGHVVEFSGDQHGSRFIQQKLETANSDEKDKIFREIQEDCLQLMQDVFGNYVIQKFFEHGDQTQKKFLANRMMGNILALSNGMYGCRVVQKALEHVLTDQQAAMVKELEKDVLKCVRDCNGNHVIQKVIDRVSIEYIHNIIEAFRGQVGSLATHTYGCRVIQRLLEKVPEPQRRFILVELHAEGPKLISDQYGNYVTQHVISHGLPEDRAKVIELVRAQLLVFSKHKFASNVVEKCLLFGTDEQRRKIMLTITAKNECGEDSLQTLIKDSFGNYVIQKLMDTLSRRDYEELVGILKPALEKARKTVTGKQIQSVEKKLHRFDRTDSPADATTTPRPPNLEFGHTSHISLADAPPTPPLTSETQSPQSSSLPSASTSTVDEPVHTSLANKHLHTPPGLVSIENAS